MQKIAFVFLICIGCFTQYALSEEVLPKFVCPKTKLEFSKTLKEHYEKTKVFTKKLKKEDVEKNFYTSSLLGNLITFITPEVADPKGIGYNGAMDCWKQLHQVALATTLQNAESHLKDWKTCIQAAYHALPPPAEEILTCWESLK